MTIIRDIYDYSECWQMSTHERAAILYLIKLLPRKVRAVEIGCYTGGFLRQLVKHFDEVISLDLTHQHLNYTSSNIRYITGDSRVELPKLMRNISDCTFFLIDGNHSYEYVQADLANVLTYIPTSETIILLHDSWYTPTRKAILDTDFNANPYINMVDVDFCSGSYANNIWVGGLCLVHMLPAPRQDPLTITQSEVLSWRKCNG